MRHTGQGNWENPKVLLRGDNWVALDKPAGWLVHRSREAGDRYTLMHWLRDKEGHHVYPVHRLDRKTTGVLIFALDREGASWWGEEIRARRVEKVYWAVVRGWMEKAGTIARPLKAENSEQMQEAITHHRMLARVQLPIAVGEFPTARYSLLEVKIEGGRYHQIRRHLRGAGHPVVGDTAHGEGRNNRVLREYYGMHGMFLHARRVSPWGEGWSVEAPLPGEFRRLCERWAWPVW